MLLGPRIHSVRRLPDTPSGHPKVSQGEETEQKWVSSGFATDAEVAVFKDLTVDFLVVSRFVSMIGPSKDLREPTKKVSHLYLGLWARMLAHSYGLYHFSHLTSGEIPLRQPQEC
jgi:hypothetical protein